MSSLITITPSRIGVAFFCKPCPVVALYFSKIDYIFSTVPIHQKVNVPIIRVEDFLNQSSMRVVQSILEGSSADFLSAYYQPELFFPHVEGRTKEEAIFNLCTQIDRVMSLPQGFYSAVLKREELARTDFCPLVAFPHDDKYNE